MSDVLLEARQLSKDFPLRPGLAARLQGGGERRLRAVDEVSLVIHRGETLGLVGESGSGKSTLARLLLRLLTPGSGSILFAGCDITHSSAAALRPLRRQMQVVFQDPSASLNPRHSVREVLGLPLRLHFQLLPHDRRQRIESLLAQVGLLAEHADCYPHELSGGMRQRVSIARALAVEPGFLVLDEPVSALDVSIQAQILRLLRRLQEEQGLTYLFITHDLAVVRQMADRIAVMQQGKLVEVGDADTVLAMPRHPYTQRLLASVPELPQEALQ